MTEQVESAISDLVQALDAREFDQAREIAMDLQQTYEERQSEERDVVDPVAQSYATQSDADIDTVTEQGKLMTESMGAQVTRVAVMTLVFTVTEAHEELEAEGLLDEYVDVTQDALAELENSELQFQTQRQDIADIDDGEASGQDTQQTSDGNENGGTGVDNGVIFGLSAPEAGIGGAVAAGLTYAGFRAYRSYEDEQDAQPISRRDDHPSGGSLDPRGDQQHQGDQNQQGRRGNRNDAQFSPSGQQSDQRSDGQRGRKSGGQPGTEAGQRGSDRDRDGGRASHTSRCPHCGRSVEAGDTVCGFCGEQVSRRAETDDNSSPDNGHISRCPNCRRTVEAGDTVCSFCDEPLGD